MIRVSDITVYLKCPRRCYFIDRGHELIKEPSADHIQRLLLKELALAYGSAQKTGDTLCALNYELDRISEEIRIIYRSELAGVDDGALANAASGVRNWLGDICSNLSSDFYASPCEFEPVLRSEKFGLTGTPDKLIKNGDELAPSIIKTGAMPENGVWKNDRMQLTAYAILVEEIYNTVVTRGFVEYARWGTAREVTIKRHERRNVLQLRDRVRKIKDGFMPEKPTQAPCERCGFKGICDVRSSLVSRFF
ncbi:MAG: Dna2/Cas4 domain-containing protein [Candidatus Methanoperedenaceae archaeon]|nr:Dna2/Cas4 domain-containing protein [Candidatus Methanoperedenaceae archaeon]